jgi:hypothetical protein
VLQDLEVAHAALFPLLVVGIVPGMDHV